MSYVRDLLDDVLSGGRTINDRATFDLLRQIAPDKALELNRLEGEAVFETSLSLCELVCYEVRTTEYSGPATIWLFPSL